MRKQDKGNGECWRQERGATEIMIISHYYQCLLKPISRSPQSGISPSRISVPSG